MDEQRSLIRKIYAGFALLLGLLVVVGAVGYLGFIRAVERVQKADDVNRLVKGIYAARLQEKNYILRDDSFYIARVDRQSDLPFCARSASGYERPQANPKARARFRLT